MANGITKTKTKGKQAVKGTKGKGKSNGSWKSVTDKMKNRQGTKDAEKSTGPKGGIRVKKTGVVTKTKKAAFLGPLNPFRKKIKNEDGSVTTYNRITGKKIKTKGKDESGNTYKIKYKGKDGNISKVKQKDSKIKYDKKTGNVRKTKVTVRDEDGKRTGTEKNKFDKDGNLKKYKKTRGIFKRSEKVKFKHDDETGANIVRKSKNVKVKTGPGGQMTGDLESAPGYKYKVKKKGDGVQVKEKGVDVDTAWGTTKKGTKKTRYDADGNQISVKTRPGGLHTATETEGDGSKFEPKGDFSKVKLPENETQTETETETPTETETETPETKTQYSSKRAEYADKNLPDTEFVEKDGSKNLRSYKDVWKTDKATRDKYNNKYDDYVKDAESYWKKKGLSRGGERRLGGAITGQARYGGSMGPQGIL